MRQYSGATINTYIESLLLAGPFSLETLLTFPPPPKMSSPKSTVALIVTSAVTLILINGHFARGQPHFTRAARSDLPHLCGKRLSDALNIICRGGGPPFYFKRASQRFEDEYHDASDLSMVSRDLDYPGALSSQLSSNEFPVVSETEMLSAATDDNFRRPRRQIVEECCLKPCTEDHLRSYCGTFH
nr:PREDICTED: LIRP [Bemisia tabaci]URF53714.1 insulin-like protein 3 [Bemisia tabaci]